jgi:hypothetical protein
VLKQPVPDVTREDVERVVRRDFPPEQFAAVSDILSEYRPKTGSDRGISRVQLAAMKLAEGRVDNLRQNIEQAKLDYRDAVLGCRISRVLEKGIPDIKVAGI